MGLTILKNKAKKQPTVSQMAKTMKGMCQANDVDSVLQDLLEGAIELVCSSIECHAVALRFNDVNGNLHPVHVIKSEHFIDERINYGEGIVDQALQQKTTIRVDDVRESEYKHLYKEVYKNTISEIAVPIIAKNLQVRIQDKIYECGEKFIGIIHIESSGRAFFLETHQEILEQLTDYAAILIEKIEHDQKLSRIRELENGLLETKIRRKSGSYFEKKINQLINKIGDIFKFESINISLVDTNRNNLNPKIRSKYVYGLSAEKAEEFKKMAVHKISSNDIQPDVVRKGLIEVPSKDDPRFDRSIYSQFGHEKLIRVFMPIFETNSSEVFGTFEAGYNSDYRPYIFEDDIRILKSLVWNIASLIEQQHSSFVEQIIHELSSPLSAIRSHASFVQMKVSTCNDDRIALKMSDILHESDMIVSQIDKLEYLFQGQSNQISNELDIQNINLFTDIIARITYQRKPDLIGLGLSPNIKFEISGKLKKIQIKTNASKLGQVIHNLMDNAIKYRNKHNPASFNVQVVMKESKKNIEIYFQDWGIGVKEEFRRRVFNEGFRDPDVIPLELGSGLGLAISKSIMLQLGGNLEVTKIHKPTEFKVSLPKRLIVS